MADHVLISPKQAPYSVSGPTAEDGFKYDQRGDVNNVVYQIDADKAIAPADQSIILVDTDSAGADVALTIDAIPAGTHFKVINTGTGGRVDISGGTGVTLTTNEAGTSVQRKFRPGTSVPASDGAVATGTHASGGDVYLDGDLEANA